MYIYIYDMYVYIVIGNIIDLYIDVSTHSSQESGKEARTAFCEMRFGGKVLLAPVTPDSAHFKGVNCV